MNIDELKLPQGLSNLSTPQLKQLAYEIRKFLIKSVSKTGGHLASNLGVVELTLALHSVFDFSKDRLVWDVGHQAYVHKILTGRKDGFDKLRTFGGISGFPKTSESVYDAFNTGHSSTSASAAMGIARARDLSGDDYDVVAVFGDGALTGGMIFEALNDAGHSNSKVIFILNDNEMSISHNVGALSNYLQRMRQKPEYFKSKDAIEEFLSSLPIGAQAATKTAKRAKGALRRKVIPTTMFDNLGLNYIGPVDGHDLDALKVVFERAKKTNVSSFIHIRTKKGKGYKPAEENPQMYHGISSGSTGAVLEDYSAAFGKTLLRLAEDNDKVVAITGAMPLGTGLSEFSAKYPKRYFDVGIAEQHAVTMAAGLSIQGYIPVVPLYSTFMQRAYDQILHDVCLQNLHVVLCADRAGVVGQDGETHQGMYDISYLSSMPNMTILSPSSFSELDAMLDYAVNTHTGPIAIRYPRGNVQTEYHSAFTPNKAHFLRDGGDILIVSSGRMINTAKTVAEHFNAQLIALPTIIPFDSQSVSEYAKDKRLVVTIEDAVRTGGIGTLTAAALCESGTPVPMLICAFPDVPITHGSVSELDKYYSMDAESIIKRIEEKLNG
ncbi:MAG: 1-deoxy-D-xylulose-5-phosphate synthase [Clostridia bacterium]|nr:1-deoxy-D-xylulose-5-phosphate synthase [Clostridia bacterium]